MTRWKLRWLKTTAVALAAGALFGSLTCVQSAADTIGSGLTFTGTTGVLGLGGPAAIAAGSGIDFLVNLGRLLAMAR